MVEPLLGVGEVGHSLFEGGDVVLFCWGGGGWVDAWDISISPILPLWEKGAPYGTVPPFNEALTVRSKRGQ